MDDIHLIYRTNFSRGAAHYSVSLQLDRINCACWCLRSVWSVYLKTRWIVHLKHMFISINCKTNSRLKILSQRTKICQNDARHKYFFGLAMMYLFLITDSKGLLYFGIGYKQITLWSTTILKQEIVIRIHEEHLYMEETLKFCIILALNESRYRRKNQRTWKMKRNQNSPNKTVCVHLRNIALMILHSHSCFFFLEKICVIFGMHQNSMIWKYKC